MFHDRPSISWGVLTHVWKPPYTEKGFPKSKTGQWWLFTGFHDGCWASFPFCHVAKFHGVSPVTEKNRDRNSWSLSQHLVGQGKCLHVHCVHIVIHIVIHIVFMLFSYCVHIVFILFPYCVHCFFLHSFARSRDAKTLQWCYDSPHQILWRPTYADWLAQIIRFE